MLASKPSPHLWEPVPSVGVRLVAILCHLFPDGECSWLTLTITASTADVGMAVTSPSAYAVWTTLASWAYTSRASKNRVACSDTPLSVRTAIGGSGSCTWQVCEEGAPALYPTERSASVVVPSMVDTVATLRLVGRCGPDVDNTSLCDTTVSAVFPKTLWLKFVVDFRFLHF